MAAALMAPLPAEIIRQRLASLLGFVVGSLAEYERGGGLLGEASSSATPDVFVGNLVDTIVGMLSQPVSEETARALEDAEAAAESDEPDP